MFTVKQVHRQDTLGLGPEELPPGDRRPLRCRVDTGAVQDGPDGAGPNRVPEPAQRTVDAAVAPGRVLPGQPQHQRAELRRHGRPATLVRVDPTAPNQVAMPAQQCRRLHEQAPPSRTGSSRTSPASTARSAQWTCGLATWRRSTATWWRRTRSPASLAAELRASSASHPITWQNSGYSSRRVMRRSSRPDGFLDELAAQHPRPTFWHPQCRLGCAVRRLVLGPARGGGRAAGSVGVAEMRVRPASWLASGRRSRAGW